MHVYVLHLHLPHLPKKNHPSLVPLLSTENLVKNYVSHHIKMYCWTSFLVSDAAGSSAASVQDTFPRRRHSIGEKSAPSIKAVTSDNKDKPKTAWGKVSTIK